MCSAWHSSTVERTIAADSGSSTIRAHERLVDLDARHRHLLQVAKAGVAGAVIVDHQLDAQVAEPAERVDHRRRFDHQHRFGKLELHPAFADAPCRHEPPHPIDEPRVVQVTRGKIDCKRLLEIGFVPAMPRVERRFEHPLRQRRDQARCSRPARRRSPARSSPGADASSASALRRRRTGAFSCRPSAGKRAAVRRRRSHAAGRRSTRGDACARRRACRCTARSGRSRRRGTSRLSRGA